MNLRYLGSEQKDKTKHTKLGSKDKRTPKKEVLESVISLKVTNNGLWGKLSRPPHGR